MEKVNNLFMTSSSGFITGFNRSKILANGWMRFHFSNTKHSARRESWIVWQQGFLHMACNTFISLWIATAGSMLQTHASAQEV